MAEEEAGAAAPEVRRRGVGFPVLPLSECVEALHRLAKYGADHSVSAFAQYLGHESSNSGPFRRKLAAFRDWKFVTTNGDRVILTPRARQLVQASKEEEARILKDTFMDCAVFANIYRDSAKGHELDLDRIRKRAVLDLGISGSSAAAFIRSFSESARSAGLAQLGDGTIELVPEDAPGRSREDDQSARPDFGAFMPAQERSADQSGQVRSVLRESWPTANGEVTLEIRSRKPLTPRAYVELAKAVEAMERLAATLGVPVETEDEAKEE